MILDTLTLAGLISIAVYLAAFLWFGRETLRVEEHAENRQPRTKPVRETILSP
jgi:hypothetical protein